MFPRVLSFPVPNIVLIALFICSAMAGQSPAGQSSKTQSAGSQTPDSRSPDTERPVIHTTSREVLLDLVVRDKHQHMVKDLRQNEVQVYEDGVLQKIHVFHDVQGAEELRTERSLERSQTSPTSNKSEAHKSRPSILNLRASRCWNSSRTILFQTPMSPSTNYVTSCRLCRPIRATKT